MARPVKIPKWRSRDTSLDPPNTCFVPLSLVFPFLFLLPLSKKKTVRANLTQKPKHFFCAFLCLCSRTKSFASFCCFSTLKGKWNGISEVGYPHTWLIGPQSYLFTNYRHGIGLWVASRYTPFYD